MTDSDKEDDGIPTAAIVTERIEQGHLRSKMLDKGDRVCEEGDELVRREDVLQKIDEQIQVLVERAEKAEDKNLETNLDVATRRLTELREELENEEASE